MSSFSDAIDLVIRQAAGGPCERTLRGRRLHLGGFHERVGDGG